MWYFKFFIWIDTKRKKKRTKKTVLMHSHDHRILLKWPHRKHEQTWYKILIDELRVTNSPQMKKCNRRRKRTNSIINTHTIECDYLFAFIRSKTASKTHQIYTIFFVSSMALEKIPSEKMRIQYWVPCINDQNWRRKKPFHP